MKILINELLMSLGGRNDRPRNSVDAWINFARNELLLLLRDRIVTGTFFFTPTMRLCVYYSKVLIVFELDEIVVYFTGIL